MNVFLRQQEGVEQLTAQRAQERVGEVVDVLVEEVWQDGDGVVAEGRAAHQGPDVDGTTRLAPGSGEVAPGALVPGALVRAEVVESEGVDLLAKPVAAGHTFVVTESLFSMDGDTPPLAEYVELCRTLSGFKLLRYDLGILRQSIATMLRGRGLKF